MTDTKQFKTASLPLAIFLHSTEAVRFIGVELVDAFRVAFVFDDSGDQSEHHVLNFERGQAVPINAVFASEKFLKRLMHTTLQKSKRTIGESNERSNSAPVSAR